MPAARPIGVGYAAAAACLVLDDRALLDERTRRKGFVEGALDRMESMRSGLFWEVNERVIAFDWVEPSLRDQIPKLRSALRRAQRSGNGAVAALEDVTPVTQDLVKVDLPAPSTTPAG